MSVKVTLEVLNKPNLMQSLSWLCTQKMPAKAAWNISRLSKQINKEIQGAREFYIEKMKSYVELDEKGNIKPNVVSNEGEAKMYGLAIGQPIDGSYIVKENAEEEFKTWNMEYMKTEVVIESYKIHMDDLGSVELAPHVINDLEDFIMTREEALEQIQQDNVVPIK